ncbi:MAG: DUF882 domain-containing protein [Candidatus Margulisiibacteriota bacterium]|nr:DUF882 domain-containing protein [Candidatus Margulisiibacteriota bacterium]
MGNLSEHFNNKDFICKCQACKGKEYKIHLGLVGALEQLGAHFKRKVEVLSGFWCEEYNEALKKERRSYHCLGKAAHVRIAGVPLNDIFNFIEQNMPEIHGLGLYPKEGFIHVDTRPVEKKDAWVKEGNNYIHLTPEKRKQYGLG